MAVEIRTVSTHRTERLESDVRLVEVIGHAVRNGIRLLSLLLFLFYHVFHVWNMEYGFPAVAGLLV